MSKRKLKKRNIAKLESKLSKKYAGMYWQGFINGEYVSLSLPMNKRNESKMGALLESSIVNTNLYSDVDKCNNYPSWIDFRKK